MAMQPTPRTEQRRPQRRVIRTGANRFDLDLSKQPADMAYRWVRASVGGLEDTENTTNADINGWTPVPAKRHPEIAGTSVNPEAAIKIGGQILMEIPKEWQKESEDLDKFEARHALESQIARLGLQARSNGAKGIKRGQTTMSPEEIE